MCPTSGVDGRVCKICSACVLWPRLGSVAAVAGGCITRCFPWQDAHMSTADRDTHDCPVNSCLRKRSFSLLLAYPYFSSSLLLFCPHSGHNPSPLCISLCCPSALNSGATPVLPPSPPPSPSASLSPSHPLSLSHSLSLSLSHSLSLSLSLSHSLSLSLTQSLSLSHSFFLSLFLSISPCLLFLPVSLSP